MSVVCGPTAGLLGRLIVGLGEGSVLVAQRASIAECFKQEEVRKQFNILCEIRS